MNRGRREEFIRGGGKKRKGRGIGDGGNLGKEEGQKVEERRTNREDFLLKLFILFCFSASLGHAI